MDDTAIEHPSVERVHLEEDSLASSLSCVASVGHGSFIGRAHIVDHDSRHCHVCPAAALRLRIFDWLEPPVELVDLLLSDYTLHFGATGAPLLLLAFSLCLGAGA